jgi:hypothetical protein
MPIQVTATISGHPWDLWGLGKIFDGKGPTQTLVKAEEPDGLPTFDVHDKDAVNRFRVWGYDVFATLTSTELLWDEGEGRVDLREIRPIAENLMERINGTAQLLDPEYRPVKPLSLEWSDGDSAGSTIFSEWTPNKGMTCLGSHPELITFAHEIFALAVVESAVKFVFDAIVLPRSWASLYLIYDAIATHVGGAHKLKNMGWVTENELSNFTNSANNSRNIFEGARHGNKANRERPLIPLMAASVIVYNLTLGWLNWLTTKATSSTL